MLRYFVGWSFRSGIRIASKGSIALFALVCLAVLQLECTSAGAADPPVAGLIGTKYKQLGGSAGPLGKPTSKEMDSKEGKGRYQTFQHGVIGLTPLPGNNTWVQSVYSKGFEMVFEWSDTKPFHYDFFIVRWDLNGKNIGQTDIKGGPRDHGKWVTHPAESGRYRLAVEGRDNNGTSRQGWSNALYFDFVVPPPIPTRYKELGGDNGPLGKPTSKEMDVKGGKGRYQTFEHGVIGFSPLTGPNSVQSVYVKGNEIVFEWGDTSPYHYDFFNVRWDLDDKHPGFPGGRNMGQEEIKTKEDTRTSGKWVTRPHSSGRYRLVVEGGDKKLGGSKIRQGWSNPLYIDFVCPPPEYTFKHPAKLPAPKTAPPKGGYPAVNLDGVPPATAVGDAKANFDKRTAAAILYNASLPLPETMFKAEENYAVRAMARLAYPDYFNSDRVPGSKIAAREEAFQSLLKQTIRSKAGTTSEGTWETLLFLGTSTKRTGDYDVALNIGLIPIIYKYYHVLPAHVQNHIINKLLNIRGPFDPNDLGWKLGGLGSFSVPETENHIMNIETARYLTNQLLYRREGDPKYDNRRNGMDEWMLKHLQYFLKNDFIEYNARPYQDYTMSALLNLYTFTSDSNKSESTRSSARVKMAAGMVLDYLMAKVAVSSNDSRRYVTFRRHAEGYSDPYFLGTRSDPQNPFSMGLAGTTDMMKAPSPIPVLNTGHSLPGNFAGEIQWAGLSDYRLPDSILDLMITRQNRVFFQRFHHYADEAYASSPSYLISSGGHYAPFAYTVAGKGKHDDIGLALPTTFMPTGQFTTADDLIRFAGTKEDEKRSNMGVAPNFACGLNPIIPPKYKPVSVGVDNQGRRTAADLKTTPPWTFIDQSQSAKQIGHDRYMEGQYGYYVAVYRDNGFGFLEAHDTAILPGLRFEDFMKKVFERNGKTSFKITGRNSYVMTDGKKIEFSIKPNSVVHLPAEKVFFVKGDILNSAAGSGYITIDNPKLKKHIVLDFSDWKAPKRTEN
jgi:hypothetical protein